MPNTTRVLIALLLLGAAGVLLWEGAFLQAQVSAFQAQVQTFGKMAVDDKSRAAPMVPVLAPPTPPSPLPTSPKSAAWARTWLALQSPADMPFPEETALEDVLKYVRANLAEGGKSPISIYVDPVGLQEAEKTLQSTVALEVKGIPLATSLKLMLKQLGLEYCIQEDGILMITSESSGSEENDPRLALISEIEQLRQEVYSLRTELSSVRGAAFSPPSSGSVAGARCRMNAQMGGTGIW